MIFVTVGSQLPFDRMIRAVDEIAPYFPQTEFIAQVFGMKYRVKNISTVEFISPIQFNDYILSAELVIAHAGTGTILSVAEMGKPLIVFPRQGKLKETRNDHQMATCRMLEKEGLLNVAYDREDLRRMLDLHFQQQLQPMKRITSHASHQLISSLKDFVSGNELLPR